MMITSYTLGQKHYPVPYAKKKLVAYISLVVLIYLIHRGLVYLWDNNWFNLGAATLLLLLFIIFIFKVERKEMERLRVAGKVFQ